MLDQLLPEPADPDARAWANAVRSAGGFVTGRQRRLVTRLVRGLKADGIWPLLDRLWLFAAETSTQALTDLRARGTATPVGGPVFTPFRGFQGNGSSSWLDSNFNATTAPAAKFTLNDASHGVWSVVGPTNTGGFEIANDFSAYSFVRIANDGSNRQYAVNNRGTAGPVAIPHGGVKTGLFHAQRLDASTVALHVNGSLADTQSRLSNTVLKNQNHGILANLGGNLSNAQLAAAFIGASLAGREAAFHGRLRAYMTAVGVP